MDYEKQIDAIKDCADKIQPHKVTIVTGNNGSGKSMLRKLVGFYLAEKLGLPANKPCTAQTSMQQRTESRPDFGALSSAMHDDGTNPTSSETLHKIKQLINACSEDNQRYIIIDEPEIGMGEEMVAALVIFLNEEFKDLKVGCLGAMIITHNRYIVSNLRGEFSNMEGKTKDEWLNREIVPTNLEQFETDSLGLFRAIQDRLNKKK
jgi:hypothetical protein